MFKKSDVSDAYPLTPMQEGMLYHHLLNKRNHDHIIQINYEIRGEFDIGIFEKAFNLLIDRYDILRTIFVYEKINTPLQVVLKERKAVIPFEDISKLDKEKKQLFISQRNQAEFEKGFDLSKDMLFKISIFKISEKRFIIVLFYHHIILDGWSSGILLKSFFESYEHLLENKTVRYEPVTQFSHFIKWFEKQDIETGKKFWRDYLSDFHFQTTVSRVAVPENAGYREEKYTYIIPKPIVESLTGIARQNKVTPNILIQTIWGILLQKLNRTLDAAYGYVVSGRPPEIPGIAGMAGLFINTIPIRIKRTISDSFYDLVSKVHSEIREVKKYEFISLTDIMSSVKAEQLFDHVVTFDSFPMESLPEDFSFSIKGFEVLEQTSFDFVLSIIPGNEWSLEFRYNAHKFDNKYIKRSGQRVHYICEQVIENPAINIEDISIVLEEEKQQILTDFNDTDAGYPENSVIIDFFETQVSKNPDNIAVKFGGTALTYAELNSKANQLSHVLIKKGIRADHIVGILLDRSMEMIISILAILKARGAYMPIDPDYPVERKNFMISDSGASLVITKKIIMDNISMPCETLLFDENLYNQLRNEEKNNPVIKGCPEDLAYVIYTSGSTGQPKGTLIENRNVVRLFFNDKFQFDFSDKDVWTVFHSFCFDFSVWEMYGALLFGGTAILLPKKTAMDTEQFRKILIREKVTILNQTPSAFYNLMEEEKKHPDKLSVRNIIFGGEALQTALLLSWKKKYGHCKLINMYGITETTVHVTYKEIGLKEIERGICNIGKPIPTLKTYIVDDNMEPVPINTVGEICVTGDGVCRGYLNRPELTAERFVNNPFRPGERLYKTGDLAYYLENGEIIYFGRKDNQVQLHGFRIELGEVEQMLLKIDGIKQAVVLFHTANDQDSYLCGYYVAETAKPTEKIREELKAFLPDYMVPSYFIHLDAIPLTSNGKINRKVLPKPEESIYSKVEYIAPRNEIEEKLVSIWQELLGVERTGIRDNFFDLGGNSLKATRLISRISKIFKKSVPLNKIFEYSTIESFANVIKGSSGIEYRHIEPVPPQEFYDLTNAQRRLWILDQLVENNIAYNIPGAFYLEGKFNEEVFKTAYAFIIKRHESLRTIFITDNEEPKQKILEKTDNNISFYDLRNSDNADKEILCSVNREISTPFHLDRGPLIRFSILRITDTKYLMIFNTHHIIFDEWSINVFIKELLNAYDSFRQNKKPGMKPLRIHYKDYSAWQKHLLNSPEMEAQKRYWLDKLSGEIPVLNLPSDHIRPGTQTFNGKRVNFILSDKIFTDLDSIRRDNKISLFMLLAALLKTLLYRYTGQEDIIIGTPVAGRVHEDLENQIGLYLNTLVLRDTIDGNADFKEILKMVKQTCTEAFDHQDYPFDMLVDDLNLKKDVSRSPLFDVILVLQNTERADLKIEDLKISPYRTESNVSKFDMTFEFRETTEGLSCSIEYNTDIYKEERIKRIESHFKTLIASIIDKPESRISDLDIIPEDEKHLLLHTFNDTKTDYPEDKTMVDLFEEQVAETPDNIAVVFEETELTYGELNARANRVANKLREAGIKPNDIVAIFLDKSIETVTAMLAVLKAGGAYLPIDPDYPENRINFIVNDSNAKVLISRKELTERVEFNRVRINLDDESLLKMDNENLKSVNSPDDLSYIIYTSGTTGKPKGVMVEHGNLVRLFFNDKFQFDFTDKDVWTMFHSHCFDFSVWEMYGALLYGGKLIIIPRKTAIDVNEYYKTVCDKRVTVLNQTPSAFYNFINCALDDRENRLGNLKYVIFGGEALKPVRLKQWQKKYPCIKLINMYGITETTVHVTYKEITPREIENNISNIGRPIPTLTAYIMDINKKLVPVGIPGELMIGGAGVSRGYLNRPELTDERFIQNPYNPNERLYCSGDLVKRLSNGDMEYSGRIDNQVQIKGFRIELGEIESAAARIEQIKEVSVIAREDEEGNKRLIAFLVSDNKINAGEIKSELSKSLPDYMIPSLFVNLNEMPLTPNGKTDKKALLDLDIDSMLNKEEYSAPRNMTEKKLCEIWQSQLNIKSIGITDNFFGLGGDSIIVIRLVSKINKILKSNLKIADLYSHQTVKDLALFLESGKNNTENELHNAIVREIERTKNQVLSEYDLPEDNIEDIYPMSDIEKGMLFYSLKYTEEPFYYNQIILELNCNNLNIERFRKALQLLFQKHSIFRSGFIMEKFVKIVYKKLDYPIEYFDISALSGKEQRVRIHDFLCDGKKNKFDIEKAPLWRITFFKLTDNKVVFIWEIHHAIEDGWSTSSCLTEYIKLLSKIENEPDYIPPDLRGSYKDYIIEELLAKRDENAREFWRNELAEYKRFYFPKFCKTKQTGIFSRNLNPDFKKELTEFSRQNNISIKHIGFAAYYFMLKMLTYQDDLVVCVLTNNRPACEDGDRILGCFLNTVPFRMKIDLNTTWMDYIKSINRKMNKIRKYDKISFLEIMKTIGEKTSDENPISDDLFNFIDFHIEEDLKEFDYEKNISHDLNFGEFGKSNALFTFSLKTTLNEFKVEINYSNLYLDHDYFAKLSIYFERILEIIVRKSTSHLDQQMIIPDEEKHQLLLEWNNTKTDYPKDKTIVDLFEEQVEKTPDNAAVVFKDIVLTYRELNAKSNIVAHYLKENYSIMPDDLIGVFLERSDKMIIALFAILKAGAAYVPLDPGYPEDRIRYMLDDAKPEIILSEKNDGLFIDINEILQFNNGRQNLEKINSPDNLAYVIYTSGSTGKPKGTLIEHGSLVNRIDWMQKNYSIGEGDSILQKTTYTFDVSVWELFWWSLYGAKVCLLNPGDEKDPEAIIEAIEKNSITTIHFVPSMYSLFLQQVNANGFLKRINSLKQIFCSGEELKLKQVQDSEAIIRENDTRLINLYGPTETTIDVTYYNCSSSDKNVPIGKPIANTAIYIVDKNNCLLPIGVTGELCIAGVGLARGYLNKPELTKEKFIENPFTPGERMYKTGDLARWLPDGNIEFLGRIDSQVKIRGFRIELEEIENVLRQYDHIKSVIVLAREGSRGDKYLIAYYVSEKAIELSEIKSFIGRFLPDYMIPSYFTGIDEFPLTPNGKLDRKALPEPDITMMNGMEYVSPRNEIEKILAGIWHEVLGIEKIGIYNSFFDMGGNSINAINVLQKINKSFDIELKLGDIFSKPEIIDLSELINEKKLIEKPVVSDIVYEDFHIPEFKNIGKNTHKILKIKLQRDITTYLLYAFPLCIVLADESKKPWFFRHFKQIFALNTSDRYLILNYAEPECMSIMDSTFLRYNEIPDNKNIVEFIIDQIDNNKYAIICLDEFYLKGKMSYNNKHFVHENMIYGYDNLQGKFYGLAFNDNGIFDKVDYDYQSIYISFKEAKKYYHESAPYASYKAIELLRLNEDHREYEFSISHFVNELNEYLTGKEPSREISYIGPSYDENDSWEHRTYGIDVYDVVIKFLSRSADGEQVIDYRAIHLLAEHKQLIHKTLIYINETYSTSDRLKKLCDDYRILSEKFNIIRIECKKIEFIAMESKINFKEKMNSIIRTLKTLKNEDEYLLSEICSELSGVAAEGCNV